MELKIKEPEGYNLQVQAILEGTSTVEKVLREIGIDKFDLAFAPYDEFLRYIEVTKALKMAEKSFLEKQKKKSLNVQVVLRQDFFKFFYLRCKAFEAGHDSRGITIKSNEDVLIDNEVWLQGGSTRFIDFDNVVELGNVVSHMLNDGYYYRFESTIGEYCAETNERILDQLKFACKKRIVDKHCFIHVDMPEMRAYDDNKYYAILNENFQYYYRDHYLRDQFLHLLSKIPLEKRKKTVIFGPYGPSMENYHKMGFKMYLHYVSNDFILDEKWDIITDLTGYYVLMDPASFTNKEMDGHDQLIDSKYMSIVSVARGIGFLHYYRMDPGSGAIKFLTEYDSYVYTPHKSIFYVLPKGFIPDCPGHQEIFMKKDSFYFLFSLVSNFIRNYAMSIDTNGITDFEKGHIDTLLQGLWRNEIISV
jgi:hypothetical protein